MVFLHKTHISVLLNSISFLHKFVLDSFLPTADVNKFSELEDSVEDVHRVDFSFIEDDFNSMNGGGGI